MTASIDPTQQPDVTAVASRSPVTERPPGREPEIGGRAGPDPTRYGDWEKNGRCIDF